MTAYYNEIDPYAAQWLRNLISAGHIAPGDVDERSIVDVRADDLKGYTQCHFFAGIGGWPYALRLAGWRDDRSVWTGSCPCQPFSGAGKQQGAADERHLWPEWFRLIRECRPAVVFGEQVARAIGFSWLDAVAHDLENEGYAIGAAVLPACSVGAPHQRDRLWFVADANSAELRHEPGRSGRQEGQGSAIARAHGQARDVADTDLDAGQQRGSGDAAEGPRGRHANRGSIGPDALADANGDERHGRGGILQVGRIGGASEAEDDAPSWRVQWPAEPDVPRVAHGVSNRVAKLRGLGNAIVPQVAAEFIGAHMTFSDSSEHNPTGAPK